jgi:hypothetical protein
MTVDAFGPLPHIERWMLLGRGCRALEVDAFGVYWTLERWMVLVLGGRFFRRRTKVGCFGKYGSLAGALTLGGCFWDAFDLFGQIFVFTRARGAWANDASFVGRPLDRLAGRQEYAFEIYDV